MNVRTECPYTVTLESKECVFKFLTLKIDFLAYFGAQISIIRVGNESLYESIIVNCRTI